MAISKENITDELKAILLDAQTDLKGVLADSYKEWVDEVAPLIAAYALLAAQGDAVAADRLSILKTIAKQKAARLVVQTDNVLSDKLTAMVVVLAKFAVKVL